MFNEGFFDYVTDINRLDGSNIKSGRNFGNYVIILDNIVESENRINSLRWENYILEFFNVAFDYIPKNTSKNIKRWNEVSRTIRNELDNTYDESINNFLIDKGILDTKEFKKTIKSILTIYGLMKHFDVCNLDNVPNLLVVNYEMLKLGYIPCGWAGKIPVGGSLYVY